MREFIAELTEQLERSVLWRRVMDDVRFDEPAAPDAAAADIVEPLRWLLERVGGGLTLTQAGYLPPAVVAEMREALGYAERYPWIGKGNREEHARPVLDLREAATRLGLLRLAKGRLSVTKVGSTLLDDAVGLWWHTATRMPTVRGEIDRHAGAMVLLLFAAGRAVDDATIAEGLEVLGWSDRRTREAIPPDDVIFLTRDTLHLLEWLGLRPDTWSGRHDPPSPAAVAFARAAVVGVDVAAPAAATDEAIELTVTLRDVTPAIWRRLVVPTSFTLRQTHAVFQTALGWLDRHLHSFDVDGVLYGDVEDFADEIGEENTTTLADALAVAPAFSYEYDFGDGWTHDVVPGAVVELSGPAVLRLVDGARACPPEDCGGPWGYAHLLEVLADPGHPEHAQLLEWTGGGFDPEAFDAGAVDAELARLDRRRLRR